MFCAGSQPSLSIVSNGAEVLMINRRFFLEHAPQKLINHLRNNVSLSSHVHISPPTVLCHGFLSIDLIYTIQGNTSPALHDDVIKWKHFPRYWYFVRGNHRSPVNSPHKAQWRGALMFSLICACATHQYACDVKLLWFETPSRRLWRHCSGSRETTPRLHHKNIRITIIVGEAKYSCSYAHALYFILFSILFALVYK